MKGFLLALKEIKHQIQKQNKWVIETNLLMQITLHSCKKKFEPRAATFVTVQWRTQEVPIVRNLFIRQNFAEAIYTQY